MSPRVARLFERVVTTDCVREPDAGELQVRFEERGVETGHGRRILRHKRGNPETGPSRNLNYRATPRLYSPSKP